MKWPTTFLLASLIASVTALGWNGTINGEAVTTIYGSIVSGLLVGHYVKTSGQNGHNPPPDSKTTITRTTEPTETL